MTKKSFSKLLFFALLLELFVFTKPVYAYLDPGSTSYLFQILIAGLLGSLFYIKTIIKWIKNIFTGRPPKESKPKEDEKE